MNFEEFLTPKQDEEQAKTEESVSAQVEESVDELDVQKVVVESLAAEKVAQEENMTALQNELAEKQAKIERLQKEIAQQKELLQKTADILAKNSEKAESTQVTLLERSLEVEDRFPGETRDHVLEALKECRDKAESEGRIRRAQLLEAVLLANESSGELKNRRENLEKFFADNQNILSGPVIEQLEKKGIAHKNGEEYLLPKEILTRNY